MADILRAKTPTINCRVIAWVTAAVRERAPARTLIAERAIAAVAEKPPKNGTARLATPARTVRGPGRGALPGHRV